MLDKNLVEVFFFGQVKVWLVDLQLFSLRCGSVTLHFLSRGHRHLPNPFEYLGCGHMTEFCCNCTYNII